MNTKLLTGLLFACFPVLALAAGGLGSLNFAPPVGDYSVVFLGNIFGIVDGVLHGTGSQIMGNMFGVFNAAVLALGGIVIMYTLLVATLNTAHEGEVLGSQWSSIWIPMRSTLGLALLIPKASGYCMMQIFIMWVIVQGIGAADKVWNAALGYLNRGGVIVQAQQAPIAGLAGTTEVAQGASAILAGQVCMLGVQQALTSQRQAYLNLKNTGAPPCSNLSLDSPMAAFCNNPVPDFISSVNMVSIQSANTALVNYKAPMPNFDSSNAYAPLNGICGTITWNQITGPNGKPLNDGGLNPPAGSMCLNPENPLIPIPCPSVASNLTPSQLETASMSRAIALEQMYMDLSTVAQLIVNNNPVLNPSNPPAPASTLCSNYAQQQLGVPYLNNGGACSTMATIKSCVAWGSASCSSTTTNAGSPIFSGTEFQGAMEDYSGIMLPTLNLINEAQNAQTANAERAFIQGAETSGWITAGSYFFALVELNGSSGAGANDYDTNTGLNTSTYDQLSTVYNSNVCSSSGYGLNLCPWLSGGPTLPDVETGQNLINSILGMLNGTGVTDTGNSSGYTGVVPIPYATLIPTNYTSDMHAVINGPLASTAYGYINNAIMVQLPGQPGLNAPVFTMNVNLGFSSKPMKLPTINFGCGSVTTFVFSFCLGGVLGEIFYNLILVNVYNFLVTYIVQVINNILIQFIMIPLTQVAGIYLSSVSQIQQPGANPIVSLANMGSTYINQASELWINELLVAVTTLIIPWFGLFMLVLMGMAAPLVAAWLSVMMAIGFSTAYYVPILPYMIFTFGSLAWIMATIEAMVAAPLVALGVSNPEGHQAFGKADASIMILMNVFLRPSLMIIGYIAAIALSYVSVWVLNSGFANAISYLGDSNATIENPISYINWSSLYGIFFSVLIYTTMYITVVQKSFNLIADLPDKVLRWIGGSPESRGGESAEWAGETKAAVDKGGEAAAKGQAAIQAEGKEATTDKIGIKPGGSMSAG